jgi:hypothetical protein
VSRRTVFLLQAFVVGPFLAIAAVVTVALIRGDVGLESVILLWVVPFTCALVGALRTRRSASTIVLAPASAI